MASTSKPFKKALINASNISNSNWVLLLLLIQYYFENLCSQMVVFVGITSIHYHSDINIGRLNMNPLS
jgi:hypothetical protein